MTAMFIKSGFMKMIVLVVTTMATTIIVGVTTATVMVNNPDPTTHLPLMTTILETNPFLSTVMHSDAAWLLSLATTRTLTLLMLLMASLLPFSKDDTKFYVQ
jgi:hypothetical protein